MNFGGSNQFVVIFFCSWRNGDQKRIQRSLLKHNTQVMFILFSLLAGVIDELLLLKEPDTIQSSLFVCLTRYGRNVTILKFSWLRAFVTQAYSITRRATLPFVSSTCYLTENKLSKEFMDSMVYCSFSHAPLTQ